MASSESGMMTFYLEEITDEAEDLHDNHHSDSERDVSEGERVGKVSGCAAMGKGGAQVVFDSEDKTEGTYSVGSEATEKTRRPSCLAPTAGLTWEEVPVTSPTRPSGRGGATLTMAGSTLWLFGGADRVQRHFNDLHAFDTRTGVWSKVEQEAASAPCPCPRSGHSACLLPDQRGVVILGGIDFASEAVYNDVHIFDTERRVWVRVTVSDGPTPAPRNSHTAVALSPSSPPSPSSAVSAISGFSVLLYGGSSPEDGPLGDTWLLSITGGYAEEGMSASWRQVDIMGKGPGAREMHAACLLPASATIKGVGGASGELGGQQMVVAGGRREDGTVERDLWALDTGSWSWVALPMGPSPRCAHSLFPLLLPPSPSSSPTPAAAGAGEGSRGLWVFGGFDGVAEIFDDATAFDLDTGAWAKDGRQAVVGRTPGKPRFSMACTSGVGAAGEREVYVFGGVNMLEDLKDLIILRRGQ